MKAIKITARGCLAAAFFLNVGIVLLIVAAPKLPSVPITAADFNSVQKMPASSKMPAIVASGSKRFQALALETNESMRIAEFTGQQELMISLLKVDEQRAARWNHIGNFIEGIAALAAISCLVGVILLKPEHLAEGN